MVYRYYGAANCGLGAVKDFVKGVSTAEYYWNGFELSMIVLAGLSS